MKATTPRVMKEKASLIKLYLTPRSPFARRVRLALRRLDIEHEEVFVDIFNPPIEYLAKQPAATVPILELGDKSIIPDSSLILDYLHENYGQKIWTNPSWQEKTASVWCVAMMTNAVNYFLETQKKNPDEETLTEAVNNIKRLLEKCMQLPGSTWMNSQVATQAGWDYLVAIEYVKFRLGTIRFDSIDFFKKIESFEISVLTRPTK